jgi:hypothetical protein
MVISSCNSDHNEYCIRRGNRRFKNIQSIVKMVSNDKNPLVWNLQQKVWYR